jgi:Fe2+ or Zn2+ uptake regulation protein
MATYSEEKIQKLLRENNLKATDHRVMILSVIAKNKTPTSLNALQTKINDVVNIDQATIYRNINSLIKAKLIRKYSHDKTKPLYEMCDSDASSTFICDGCKSSQNFKSDNVVKNFLKTISKKSNKIKGFEANFIEVHGTCKKCK